MATILKMIEAVPLPITCPHKDKSMLKIFGLPGICEWCHRKGKRQAHHIHGRGMGGAWRLDHPLFLVSVCKVCHWQFQHEKIPREKAVEIAAKREGVSPEWAWSQFWRLRSWR